MYICMCVRIYRYIYEYAHEYMGIYAFSSSEAALLLVSTKKSRPLAWFNDILFLNGFVNAID